MKILKVTSIVIAVYIVYIAFYNSFGSSFGLSVLFSNIYHLMNSLVMFFGFLMLYLAKFDKALTVTSGVAFIYNGLLSIFNIACVVGAKEASEWILASVLSGISIFSIFVLLLILFIYVGLDKRQ